MDPDTAADLLEMSDGEVPQALRLISRDRR
jgi:hypothetical protein